MPSYPCVLFHVTCLSNGQFVIVMVLSLVYLMDSICSVFWFVFADIIQAFVQVIKELHYIFESLSLFWVVSFSLYVLFVLFIIHSKNQGHYFRPCQKRSVNIHNKLQLETSRTWGNRNKIVSVKKRMNSFVI